MGSRPSKVAPARSRSGLSFVSTSSVGSLDTIDSNDVTMPEGVRNLIFDEVTTKSLRVGWDPPRNFTPISYQVRLFPPDKIKSRTLLRAHRDRHHTFTRLQSSTEYTVAVIAVDAEKNKSPCETATTCTLPRPPRDLKFSPDSGADAVEIFWKHCKGRPGVYDAEIIENGEEHPMAQARGLTGCNTTFSGLIPGTNYTVNVKNVAKGMNSEPISGKWLTTPRHVSDLTFVDVTQNEMRLKWKKPEGNVNSYTLYLTEKIKKPKEPIVIERLKQTTYSFNGLIPGRVYMCKIVSNASSKTSKAQYFTQCTVPLEVAGITAGNIGPEEAVIRWTPGFGDADDYDLFLTPTEGVLGQTSPRGVTGREYKFTGLVPGTVYTVGVVTNAKDKSSKRAISSFATVPGMVGDLEISITDRSCTTQQIKWPPAAGRVDSYVINIRREDKSEEGKTIENVFQPRYMLTELAPGTLYEVHVAAMRDGRESSSVHKTFGTVPSNVSSILFNKEKCTWDCISLSWEPASGGVEEYRLACKTAVGTPIETIVSSSEAAYAFKNLLSSTLYDVSVTTISNGIESAPTQGKQMTGPDQIINFQATSTSKKDIKIFWNPPPNGADEYFIKLSLLEEDCMDLDLEEWSLTDCTHTFSNLIPGSHYEITVTPVASMVRGKPATEQVHTKPGDIVNVHISEETVTTDSIAVKWWGIEGNSKNVDVILTRLKKNDDVINDSDPFIVKEEHILSKDNAPNEVVFTGLESNTVYGIRMRGVGKDGVGNEAVYTQATRADATDIAPPEKTKTQSESNLPLSTAEHPIEETMNIINENAEEKIPEKQHDSQAVCAVQNSTPTISRNNSESNDNAEAPSKSDQIEDNTESSTVNINFQPENNLYSQTTQEQTKEVHLSYTSPQKQSSLTTAKIITEPIQNETQMENDKLEINLAESPQVIAIEPETTSSSDKNHHLLTDPVLSSDIKEEEILPNLDSTSSDKVQIPSDPTTSSPDKEEKQLSDLDSSSKTEQSNSPIEEASHDQNDNDSPVTDKDKSDSTPESAQPANASLSFDIIAADTSPSSNLENHDQYNETNEKSPEPIDDNPIEGKQITEENQTEEIKQTLDESIVNKNLEETTETTSKELEAESKQIVEDTENILAAMRQNIKPVLVIPTKKEDCVEITDDVKTEDASTSKTNVFGSKRTDDLSSNTSTPLLEKKETNSLAFLAALTSSD